MSALARISVVACVLATSAGLAGCPPPPPARRALPALPPLVVGWVDGVRTAVLPRPVPSIVHLSVWIDAGSRDAEPPEVATLAAWVAAGRGGLGIAGRVLPDATELSVPCPAAALEACLRHLGDALRTREVEGAEIAALARRLAASRARTDASPLHRVDRLALASLLGATSSGFLPLGDGATPVSPERVAQFLTNHFGRDRALVVASGALRAEELDQAVRTAWAAVPTAAAARADRALEVAEEPAPVVEVGDAGLYALWATFPDVARARAVAARIGARLAASPRTPPAAVEVLAVRGGALLGVRAAGASGLASVGDAARWLARAAVEPDDGARPWGLAADPRDEAAALGTRWAAERPAAPGGREGVPISWGVGGLVPVAARRLASDAAPSAPELARATARLGEVLRAADDEAWPTPDGAPAEGAPADERAEATTPAGATLRAVRRDLDGRVGIVARFAPGAADDPPEQHGSAALLAESAAIRCRERGAALLGGRAHEAAVRAEPGTEAWWVALEVPAEDWGPWLDVLEDCALAPELETETVERARRAVLLRLASASPFAPLAASGLAPATPGLVAPDGTSATVSRLPPQHVVEAWATSHLAPQVQVAVVGPLTPGDVVARLARRTGALGRSGAAPRPGPAAGWASGVRAGRWPFAGPAVVVLWQAGPATDGALPALGPLAAAALAEGVAPLLDARDGIDVGWRVSGTSRGSAWAAVGIDCTEEALDRLPATLAEARSALPERALAAIVDRLVVAEAFRRAAPAAAALAELEGTGDVELRPGSAEAQEALALARRLLESDPAFVVGRSAQAAGREEPTGAIDSRETPVITRLRAAE